MLSKEFNSPVSVRDGVLGLFRHFSVGLCEALGLEAGVPAKVVGPSGFHDLTRGLPTEQSHLGVLFTGAVGQSAHRYS